MQLSNDVLKYLRLIQILRTTNSNFLIADLEKIIYTTTYNKDNYYINKPISKDLISLIKKFNKVPVSEDVFILENTSKIKLFDNDENIYSGIIILPIYLNNKVEGITIFFRDNGAIYSKNHSIKAPNTIRKWIMQFMGNDIFPI